MAWNSEKKHYECDRCGKPINCAQTLCKECDEWLKEYMSKRKEKQMSDVKDQELTIDCEISKDSVDAITKMFNTPDDIRAKIVDIYNYLATSHFGGITLQFESGIKIKCEIDASEWKNPPRINLDEVLGE